WPLHRSSRSGLVLRYKNTFAVAFTPGDHQFSQEIWRFLSLEVLPDSTKCPSATQLRKLLTSPFRRPEASTSCRTTACRDRKTGSKLRRICQRWWGSSSLPCPPALLAKSRY